MPMEDDDFLLLHSFYGSTRRISTKQIIMSLERIINQTNPKFDISIVSMSRILFYSGIVSILPDLLVRFLRKRAHSMKMDNVP
jgi:hypothetical protein